MSQCIEDVYEPYPHFCFSICGGDYCCIIDEISKSELLNLSKDANLSEKKNIITYK